MSLQRSRPRSGLAAVMGAAAAVLCVVTSTFLPLSAAASEGDDSRTSLPGSGAVRFVDVGTEHPFFDDIAWAVERGITEGYTDGSFRPTDPISRQTMAGFVHRFDGGEAPVSTEPYFADVDATNPFFEDIQWLFEAGATTGQTAGDGKPQFNPTGKVSRQAMAAVLHRYQIDPAATSTEPAFSDVGASSPFFEAVQWLSEAGIALGSPSGGSGGLVVSNAFLPTLPVSRQAAAAFLHRYDSALDPTLRCNKHRELCDRPFNAVSYPTTHNAMSSAEDGWAGPNQEYNMVSQLDDGVRGFMLDTHYNSTLTAPNMAAPDAPDGVPLLCHGYCKYGWRLLSDGLEDLRLFLDDNPGEVVTIIFESYVSASDTRDAFEVAGLLDLTVTQVKGEPWPTLRQMVKDNKRVVVLTASGGGTYPWYMKVWDHAFDTNWSAKKPGDLSCDKNSGSASNSLFILNNFLTDPVARRPLADSVNHNPFFIDRARDCEAARSHIPNFPTVDFYDRGDLFLVVDELNGV